MFKSKINPIMGLKKEIRNQNRPAEAWNICVKHSRKILRFQSMGYSLESTLVGHVV
jgi:hypothetical protein